MKRFMNMRDGRQGCAAVLAAAVCCGRAVAQSPDAVTDAVPFQPQRWNWHAQNTDIVDGYPGFPAKYDGPSSLSSGGETRETVSLDLYGGLGLWRGAEAHVDGLMWQGFGFSKTVGVESFPNGEAFKIGTSPPNVNMARYFIRQTIGFGGETEIIEDDALHLRTQEDVSRLTITLGRMSAKDVFDNNAYANDPRTQFMSWSLMANAAWDYPGDALGYTTGLTLELNQRDWTARYGFFQMPSRSNGSAMDAHVFEAWGMVTEGERRFKWNDHPGAIRLLAFLNRAHMGSYSDTVDDPALDANIDATAAYRYKYGVGLNFEQELCKDVGFFSRLGWSDGKNQAWVFSDVDRTATAGFSVKGELWKRADDTVGVAAVANGLSSNHQRFYAIGGTGILGGDGALNYGWEKDLETYYDAKVWKGIRATFDYQFVTNPAFNRDRGPVSVFSGRIHWEF